MVEDDYMASNAKSKARSKANKDKRDGKFVKLLSDIHKVIDVEELRPHYVGSGQDFTRPVKKT